MSEFEQINILLTTEEDSPPITDEDVDDLIEFCREEIDSTGEFRVDKFEDAEIDNDTMKFSE